MILPRRNDSDLEDDPEDLRRACRVVLAPSVDEVLSEPLKALPQG